MSMKILYYTYPANMVAGTGTGRVTEQLVGGMAALGQDQVRGLCSAEDLSTYRDDLPQRVRNVDFLTFGQPFSRQQRQWFLTNRPAAEGFWNDVQIVHSATEAFVPTRKAASVVTLHDAAFFDDGAHQHDLNFYKQRLKYHLLFRKLARRTDAFHTVSQFSAERFAHHFPAIASRLTVIPNGVADIFYQPQATANPADDPFGFKGRPFVLLPRGLVYRKNADLVLEAWPDLERRFPDLLLAVPSQNIASYVQKARAISDRIRILGYVSDEALARLYRQAAAVWFPSRYEGFGIPVLEAMASGTPVLASDATSLPEVAGDAAMLVDVNDTQAHIEALTQILRDDSLAADLVTRGRKRAENYRWQKAITAMRQLYTNLV